MIYFYLLIVYILINVFIKEKFYMDHNANCNYITMFHNL